LLHSTKTVHNIFASKDHMSQLYESFTRMCEDQTHTDLTLVTADGKAFGVHKLVLVGCSQTVKSILSTETGCRCEKPTLYLPDFPSYVVKSLLCLLYTGHCEGDCNLRDLKPLANVLQIDIQNVCPDSGSSPSEDDPAAVNFTSSSSSCHAKRDNDNISNNMASGVNRSGSSGGKPYSNGGSGSGAHHMTAKPEPEYEDVEEDVARVEVTPEVHNFFGNHFLAASSEVATAAAASEDNGTSAVDVDPANHMMFGSGVGGGNGGGSADGYLCRLCGRTTASPASLFSHLLYPHYAHLWRDDVPQRKQKYDCQKCDYSTKNRQRYVMHIARVHDDLKKKLTELGENLEVLANTSYSTRCTNPATSRIVSKIAKMRSSAEGEDAGGNEPAAAIDSFNFGNNSSYYTSPPGGGEVVSAAASGQNLDSSLIQQRTPNGHPRLVRCKVCGSWKRRENFFTHMVSVHFRQLWDDDIPKSASNFLCDVAGCRYNTKYRYNMLFHVAGRHKQLRDKLAQESISDDILVPLEPDDPELDNFQPRKVSSFQTGSKRKALTATSSANSPGLYGSSSKYFAGGRNGGGGSPVAAASSSAISGRFSPDKKATKKLECKVCGKIAHNHASHRLHVVSKHFSIFWSHLRPDDYGVFACHHSQCEYRSSNRQVFIIHLAFVHSELKLKLEQSGQDPALGEPLGKRNSIIMPRQKLSVEAAAAVACPTTSDSSAAVMKSGAGFGAVADGDEKSCRFCSDVFDSHRSMIEHLALSHLNHLWDGDADSSEENPYAVQPTGPFPCSRCEKDFEARDKYILHLVFHHNVLQPILGEEFESDVIKNGGSDVIKNGGRDDEDEDDEEQEEEEDEVGDDDEEEEEEEEMDINDEDEEEVEESEQKSEELNDICEVTMN